jgi:hypothetical protein
LLAHGRWFSLGTPASSITKTGRHDIAEILLKDFGWNNFNIRPGFGCQTALLKIIEDWKKALDDSKFIAAILMDLSKAFDCLPHNLLLLSYSQYDTVLSSA